MRIYLKQSSSVFSCIQKVRYLYIGNISISSPLDKCKRSGGLLYTFSSQEQKVLLQRVYDMYLTVYSVQSEIGWISLWMWMKRRERSSSSPPAPRCSPARRSSPSWPCWGSSWGSWVSWVSAGSWNSLPGSSCPPTQRPPQHCSLQFRVQWVRYGTIIILVERLIL